jgi:hypothetical protein
LACVAGGGGAHLGDAGKTQICLKYGNVSIIFQL